MAARSEITNRIPSRRHFEKGGYPKKWTRRFSGYLPDCTHIEKGNAPKKWTQEKDNESPKVDSGERYKNDKVDI